MPFCTDCGKKLAKGEKCTCKTAAPAEKAAQETQATQTTQTEQPKKSKKPLIITILVALVVIAAAIVILIVTYKPHMKPINDFVSAVNKQNASYIELNQTLMPDFAAKKMDKVYKELLKGEDSAERYESMDNSLMYYYQNLTDSFGKWKLKFELRDAVLLTGDELETVQGRLQRYYENNIVSNVTTAESILNDKDMLEDFADDKDISKREAKNILEKNLEYWNAYKEIEVGEVYEIKGKFILKAGGEKYDTDTLKLYVANVNGDWFYYSFREGDMEFDSEVSSYMSFLYSYMMSGKYYISVE